MRTALWVLAVAVLVVLAWGTYRGHARAEAAEAEIAALQVGLEAAKARARADSLRADSLAQVATDLAAERDRAQAEAEARARTLTRRADSLSQRVSALVAGTEAAEEVEALVGQMRASYEEQLAEVWDLVAEGKRIEQTLLERDQMRDSVEISLRSALALAEQQRDRCLEARSPGLMERIRENVVLVGGTVVVTLLAVLVVG
jgi:hypothetical protein